MTRGKERISSQFGLFFGSVWMSDFMMAYNSWEYFLGIGGIAPLVTFLNKPYISSAQNGGFKLTISNRTHPKDQMSDFKS